MADDPEAQAHALALRSEAKRAIGESAHHRQPNRSGVLGVWLPDSAYNALWELFTEAEARATQAERERDEARGQVTVVRDALAHAAAEAHARCPGGSDFTKCAHRHCQDAARAWADTASTARAHTAELLAPWQEALREVYEGLEVSDKSTEWSASTAARLKELGL